jgi:membrane-associated phospholipid phosphatase
VIGFALACSRVVLDVHFLSDVIAGFAIGILVSQYVYIQMKKKEYKV